jgi:hypothetical protein
MGNRKNQRPFCKITPKEPVDGVPGVDAAGDLWLPEAFWQGSFVNSEVVEYTPSCGKPIFTLQDPAANANDVAIGSDGTIYVTNFVTNSSGSGDIAIYSSGQTTPSRVIKPSGDLEVVGAVPNSKNDVFATYYECETCRGAGLLMFPGGEGPGQQIKDPLLRTPGVPIVDKNDNILVPNGTSLHVFSPPYTSVSKKLAVQGKTQDCSLNRSQNNLACADYGKDTIDMYAYPSLKYSYSFSKDLPTYIQGIAQAPGTP